MKVNEKLRLLRETHHLSQEEMANKLSMSTKGYAKIERGETRSNLPRLEQISEIFNMDICELLAYGEEEKIVNLDKSVFNNSENSLNHSIISLGTNDIEKELEKLHLIISHKDEIIENLKRENKLLLEMNELLKNK
ncbi:helix-turn-helix domain-containing protein [[Haemophilus] felis]|uniref:Transcriptional regulator n=1 Tax=[Haemophilus] felis TaxID=123822 RepID=A0A1T0B6D0_9PAST|nr:helix-turn-helix domain-containing protein [[Haemophilus] felis]NBI40849.1 helix-turn-helix domain-containing protein [[Haemophilus] felis]OOS05552.1 transcriptional regulator [[Haemophilus] felis]